MARAGFSSTADRSLEGFCLTFWVLPSDSCSSADNLGLLAAQQGCFSLNCVYLVAWDVRQGPTALLNLRHYLAVVNARASNYSSVAVLLVATHLEGTADERGRKQAEYKRLIGEMFNSPRYIALPFMNSLFAKDMCGRFFAVIQEFMVCVGLR